MIQTLLYTSLALVVIILVLWILYQRFIFSYNADRVTALASIVAAVGGIAALLVFSYQAFQLARQVELQADTAYLEQRPQIYLVQRPPNPTCQNPICIWFNESEGAWFAGTDLHFRNVGKYPATITGADYKVLSDVRRKTDLVGWFKQVYGEMPGPKVVFPGQEDTVGVPGHPIVGSKSDPPRLLYIAAAISYTGPRIDKKYWYTFSALYLLHSSRDATGNHVYSAIELLKSDQNWDRIGGPTVPTIKEPIWENFLSNPYISGKRN